MTDARLDSLEVMGDRAAVTISWRSADGERAGWSHLLELRGGRIVRMRDAGGR